MQSEMPVYAWRPFDVAQDRLGAINFLRVVIENVSKVESSQSLGLLTLLAII